MNLHDPIHVLLLGVFLAGYLTGVIVAVFVMWLEARKWCKQDRPWIGFDHGADDGCTVYGHYDRHGILHIDRVEFDGDGRG